MGEELEYKVEKVLDSRKCWIGRKTFTEFLISWKGYSLEHHQWVKKKDLFTWELLKDFLKKHPSKPR